MYKPDISNNQSPRGPCQIDGFDLSNTFLNLIQRRCITAMVSFAQISTMKELIIFIIVALLHVVQCAIGGSGVYVDMGHCVSARNVTDVKGSELRRVGGQVTESMYEESSRIRSKARYGRINWCLKIRGSQAATTGVYEQAWKKQRKARSTIERMCTGYTYKLVPCNSRCICDLFQPEMYSSKRGHRVRKKQYKTEETSRFKTLGARIKKKKSRCLSLALLIKLKGAVR